MAHLASRQHGNVTRAQLLELGVTRNALAWWVQNGRLVRVHRGVYALGRPPVVPLERAAAAVLACGPHAALSHGSALALWGLSRWPERFEITVTRGDPRPKGITVHRSPIPRGQLSLQRGIRVTSVARTLLDCAPRLTDAQLIRAVNDARTGHLCSPGAVTGIRHPQSRRVAHVLNGPVTRSRFEDRFAALCARYDLPIPLFNTYVCGYEVDALFAAERLIVELDSWQFHQDRASFVRDRNRDADTLAAGYATVRITWERPDAAEARRLHDILSQRRDGGGAAPPPPPTGGC